MSRPVKVPVRLAPWHPDIPEPAECRERLGRLTARQREVVELLARGWTQKQVAARLGSDNRRAVQHCLNDPDGIYAKLGVRPAHLAVALYHRALLSPALAVVPDPEPTPAAEPPVEPWRAPSTIDLMLRDLRREAS